MVYKSSSIAATSAGSGGGGSGITALTGDVTASGTGSVPATIAGHAVSYAKMQQEAASTLLGNPSGASANIQEITLGTNLSFTGSVLNAAGGGGGTPGGSSGQIQYNNASFFGGAAGFTYSPTTINVTITAQGGGVTALRMIAGGAPSVNIWEVTNSTFTPFMYMSSSFQFNVVGDCNGSAVGPIIARANNATQIGTALSLDATASTGGKIYNFISTGPVAGPGAGCFAVYNGSDNRYCFLVDSVGRYISGFNQYIPLAQVTIYPFSGATKGLVIYGPTANSFEVQDGTGALWHALNLKGNVTTYNAITTAGLGHPTIYAKGDFTAQTGTVTPVAAYTPAATGSFIVTGYLNITAIATDVIKMTITYQDENNTSQTLTPLSGLATTGNNSFTSGELRCNNTAITVAATLTTGTGSITFDVGATIMQLA